MSLCKCSVCARQYWGDWPATVYLCQRCKHGPRDDIAGQPTEQIERRLGELKTEAIARGYPSDENWAETFALEDELRKRGQLVYGTYDED